MVCGRKDSINIFGETLRWEHLNRALQRVKPILKLVDADAKAIPRTLIYRIYKTNLNLKKK